MSQFRSRSTDFIRQTHAIIGPLLAYKAYLQIRFLTLAYTKHYSKVVHYKEFASTVLLPFAMKVTTVTCDQSKCLIFLLG
ncbi:Uncharacterized protein APZ42_020365 [Daphnia magna]|uniref:Uncharacterized protein n=1 Tax=Daphnia magna TaxID=35525 RepID=A0A0P6JW28_9CRUS|nr:Uncharacterized protein APZ42_020365 [Daphnia magna]